MFKNQLKIIFNENVLINKSQTAAFAIINKSGNFVHDIFHINSVEKNVIRICKHENASVLKFKEWAQENKIDKTIIDKVTHIILKHRNRKARNKSIDKLSAILWDADKLDIINIARCNRILFAYENNMHNDQSEFNYHDSLKFWINIDGLFINAFHTNTAKDLFKSRLPPFKQFLGSISN